MQETGNSDIISVQVTRDGFSLKYGCARSGWLGADHLFTVPELSVPHEDVEISFFTDKFALVPASFFRAESARSILSETVSLLPEDTVLAEELPRQGAWAVYASSPSNSHLRIIRETLLKKDGSKGSILPEQCRMLSALEGISEYNKILASWAEGRLYLVIARGRALLLCNSFEAPDFVTAEYYIFLVMSRFQLNPEQSTVYFRTPLSEDEQASLYSYFRGVEMI